MAPAAAPTPKPDHATRQAAGAGGQLPDGGARGPAHARRRQPFPSAPACSPTATIRTATRPATFIPPDMLGLPPREPGDRCLSQTASVDCKESPNRFSRLGLRLRRREHGRARRDGRSGAPGTGAPRRMLAPDKAVTTESGAPVTVLERGPAGERPNAALREKNGRAPGHPIRGTQSPRPRGQRPAEFPCRRVYDRNCSTTWATAGPRMTMKMAGKMKNTSGKSSLTEVLAARSSASWRRFWRRDSEWMRSEWPRLVP